MSQTNDFMANMRSLQAFDDITLDMQEYMAGFAENPKVYCAANFTDMETLAIIFDRFCAIMERDDSGQMNYIAIGRNESHMFLNGKVQVIDVRYLDDDDRFQHGIDLFKALVEGYQPSYVREVPGEWEREDVVDVIVDCWKLAGEREMYGGAH